MQSLLIIIYSLLLALYTVALKPELQFVVSLNKLKITLQSDNKTNHATICIVMFVKWSEIDQCPAVVMYTALECY